MISIKSLAGIAATLALSTAAWQLSNAATTYQWDLPEGIAPPRVPDNAPMTVERVELGRHLFYDQRLSGNGTQSCASCHLQEL
ncbi:MAG: cytochrome c peroxidase, partial [Steroidobacteraceae bacterium]